MKNLVYFTLVARWGYGSGGSKEGGARDAPLLLGVQILSISCSFGENLAKSYVGEILDPPLYGLRYRTIFCHLLTKEKSVIDIPLLCFIVHFGTTMSFPMFGPYQMLWTIVGFWNCRIFTGWTRLVRWLGLKVTLTIYH